MMVSALMFAIICSTHVHRRASTYEEKVNTILSYQPYKASAVMNEMVSVTQQAVTDCNYS